MYYPKRIPYLLNNEFKQNIEYYEIEKEFPLMDILELKDTKERIQYLKNYLCQKTEGKTEMPFLEVVEELYKSPKEQTVIAITEKFCYHERHLYRVFKANYSVSPKVLLNILRFFTKRFMAKTNLPFLITMAMY